MRVWHDDDRSNTEAGNDDGSKGNFNGHKTFYGDLDRESIRREKHLYYKGNLYTTTDHANGTRTVDYNITRHRADRPE